MQFFCCDNGNTFAGSKQGFVIHKDYICNVFDFLPKKCKKINRKYLNFPMAKNCLYYFTINIRKNDSERIRKPFKFFFCHYTYTFVKNTHTQSRATIIQDIYAQAHLHKRQELLCLSFLFERLQ